MQSDLLGRVGNTKLPNQQALLPVFEAVVNAIHSCNDLKEGELAEINVKLLRAEAQSNLPETGHLTMLLTERLPSNYSEAASH